MKINQIKKVIKNKAREMGLSQEKLGEKIGISQSEVSRFYNNTNPTWETLKRFLDAVGISLSIESRHKKIDSYFWQEMLYRSHREKRRHLQEFIKNRLQICLVAERYKKEITEEKFQGSKK